MRKGGDRKKKKILKGKRREDRPGQTSTFDRIRVLKHFLTLNWLKLLSPLFMFCFWNNCCICRTPASWFEIGDKVGSSALSPSPRRWGLWQHTGGAVFKGEHKKESSSFKMIFLPSQRCHPVAEPVAWLGKCNKKKTFYHNQLQQGRSNLDSSINGQGTGLWSHGSNNRKCDQTQSELPITNSH